MRTRGTRTRAPGRRAAVLMGSGSALALLVVGAAPVPVSAAGLADLVSPGDLIQAHQREARSCDDCHQSFERSSQKQLCIVCHEEIGSDLEQKRGLHGRSAQSEKTECSVCHTEHEGKGADIVGLVPESFDHGRTGFVLEGAHASESCTGCHARGDRYRDAEPACVACHGKQDPHGGELGDRCEQCHSPDDWTGVVFDHAETDFPLEGRHADAECASCHPQQRFGGTVSMECVSCHQVDDVHRGRLGPACADCHDSAGWKKTAFDHGRKTRFALKGAHARLDCRSCHESDPKAVALPMDCKGCHALDDDHRGARGTACADCHDSASWKKTTFDHRRDAHFALDGAHANVDCSLCHVGGTTRELETPKRCVECHALADVHQGSLGPDCGGCHQAEGWAQRVVFDHDLTDFPLLSLHQLASCEDCHADHRFGETDSDCVACHARDDDHERRLGQDCVRCHNPNGWRYWFFDHARDAGFALDGGHEGLQCVACHLKPSSGSSRDLDASPRCSSCHLGDSPHDDAFGRDCGRCHVDDSWKRTVQGVGSGVR